MTQSPEEILEPNWDKPSLAVIVNFDQPMLATWAGPHVKQLVDEVGSRAWDELCQSNAPPGISIWEGVMVGGGFRADGEYDDVYLSVGKYRQPTAEELASIVAGKCPWNDEDWRVKS